MLKTASTAGSASENLEQGGQGVQVKDWNKKELAQKSRKGQKTAKSKKWIRAEKSEASRAKNLSSQSGLLLTLKARKAFIKLKQAFVEAPILNHFDPERDIEIEIDAFDYAIGGILSQLTSDNLS